MTSQTKPAMDLSCTAGQKLKSFMENIDAVIFDCDGVLWLHDNPLENAKELVILLRSMGKKVFFLSNNSTMTRAEFLAKFTTFGFEATEDEIMSAAYLTALYLKEIGFKRKAYVAGWKAIVEELANVGIEGLPVGPDPVPATKLDIDPEVGAVVIGFDEHFSYVKAMKAATYLNQKNSFGEERLFIATDTDHQIPPKPGREHLVYPGAGAFVSTVKTCSGKEPTIIAKPAVFPFQVIQKQHKVDPKRVLMVGDMGTSDVLFGKRCGLWTLLVLSGVTTIEQVHRWEQSATSEEKLYVPDYFAKNVKQFYELLLKM